MKLNGLSYVVPVHGEEEEWEEEKGILFYKWLKKFRDIHRLLILLYNLEEF